MVPTLSRTRGKECFVNLTMQAVHEKTVLEVLDTASPLQGKRLVQSVDEVLVLFHVCPPPAIFVSTLTEIQYADVFIKPSPMPTITLHANVPCLSIGSFT